MSEETDDLSPRKVSALKKLAEKNFGEFSVAVQHLSSDVQMKVIEQLPNFRKLATGAIDAITKTSENVIVADQQSESHVHAGYVEWRRALASLLDQPDLSLEQKLLIVDKIGDTVKEQSAKDSEGKRFKDGVLGKVLVGAVVVLGVVVVAATGGKITLPGGKA